MSEERITALEKEVARLSDLLEKPKIRLDLSYKSSHSEILFTATNLGMLPIVELCFDIQNGGKSLGIVFKIENHDRRPWPILCREFRQYVVSLHELQKLRSQLPNELAFVLKDGDKQIDKMPVGPLLDLIRKHG